MTTTVTELACLSYGVQSSIVTEIPVTEIPHRNPDDNAPSDGPNMVPLDKLEALLE